jgi:hypothetical protein
MEDMTTVATKKSGAKAKEKPRYKADENWDYEREQVFDRNRKLEPGQRNLISLFYGSMSGKLLPAPKGSRWIMLMMVDLSTYTVIEQAAVSSDWSDEQWRLEFQEMYLDRFATAFDEVATAAFGDYKRGERKMGILCQRYDNVYPRLDIQGQKATRLALSKKLNKMLHTYQTKLAQKRKSEAGGVSEAGKRRQGRISQK